MQDETTRTTALEALYEAARFLKRINVQAFATQQHGFVVDLHGGTLDDWKNFWSKMDAVGILIDPPKKMERVRLDDTTATSTEKPKIERVRL